MPKPRRDETREPPRAKLEGAVTAGLAVLALAAGGFALRPQAVARGPVALESPAIRVSVSGEVRRPGVYELPFGSRAQAAIDAAGGLTANAERSLIRPAEPLEDGEPVLVPSRLVAGAAQNAGAAVTAERVNLNSATLAQLEALPGVGPKLAARIVAGRPYSSLADLDAVKGVGPSMLAKLGPLVKF